MTADAGKSEMNQDTVWNLFEKTGSINVYMLYNDLKDGCGADAVQNVEDGPNADQDRRTDNPGAERRGK